MTEFCTNRFSLPLGRKTYIMGILNVTPDSFSDGGLYLNADAAVRRAVAMQREGADLIDVGAMSTRPGSLPVSVKDEISRLSCLPDICRRVSVPVSVDTFHAETADFALQCGASIINDVSGRFDANMTELIKRNRCGYIVMHAPCADAQTDRQYPNGVVGDVNVFFDGLLSELRQAGVRADHICVDPGFGFSKNTADNIELLQGFEQICAEKRICRMAALSRKRFIGEITNVADADQRLSGTLAAGVIAIQKGADILRVHDVQAAVQAARIADSVYR